MNEPIFRMWLVFAALGVASLALTACGGSAGDDDAVAAEPQARALALGDADTTANADAQRPDDALAADAAAASQEPR